MGSSRFFFLFLNFEVYSAIARQARDRRRAETRLHFIGPPPSQFNDSKQFSSRNHMVEGKEAAVLFDHLHAILPGDHMKKSSQVAKWTYKNYIETYFLEWWWLPLVLSSMKLLLRK